jgi:hypothetical protein
MLRSTRALCAVGLWLLAAPAFAQTVYPSTTDPTAQPSLQPGVATLDGTFDPYADPTQAPSLAPSGDPAAASPWFTPPAWGTPIRLVQNLGFEYTMLGGNGGGIEYLGLDEVEVWGTFALPLAPAMAPFELTPGFATQWWDGPGFPVFPPRTYSAYLDIGWRPQITNHTSLELAVRPGVYSDFRDVDSEAIRIQGKGLVIVAPNNVWQYVAGVLYLDRVDVKLLPAGGVIWTPTPDVRYEILFPQPRFASRLVTYGNLDWWWFLGAEYGGDSWSVATTGGRAQTDYNDIRVFGGLEFKPCPGVAGWRGHIELGYVFDREIQTETGIVTTPDDTLMLRAGLNY